MAQASIAELNNALDFLYQAQTMLFIQLTSAHWNCVEIVNGLDKLEYALEFTRKWNEEIQACSKCGSIYLQALGTDHIQCLDCDYHWASNFKRPVKPRQEIKAKARTIDIHTAISYMEKALRILTEHKGSNLIKAADYLKDSINWIEKALPQIPTQQSNAPKSGSPNYLHS